LFVYQLQPLTPELACCVIHVVKAMNAQGSNQTVETLEEIAEILDSKCFTSSVTRSTEIPALTNFILNFNNNGTFKRSGRHCRLWFSKTGPDTWSYLTHSIFWSAFAITFIWPFSNRGRKWSNRFLHRWRRADVSLLALRNEHIFRSPVQTASNIFFQKIWRMM
jgi:hypothetical protein